MKFDIYEQQKQTNVKKRILKSKFKNIKYESSSFNSDCRAKQQGSDYYVGVYDSKKDKCYLVPVGVAYQMQQKIAGFADKFGVQQDIDQQVQQLSHYA